MADAAIAAPTPGAVPEPGGTTGTAQPSAKETQAQKAARLRVDLGDGEQEYDQSHVAELAKRGRKAAQTLSLAEKRAQEAGQRERAAEERFNAFKSGDPKAIRKALKEMGVDERTLANEVGRDMLEDMELEKDPVRKKLRDAERKLQDVEEGKKSEAEKQRQAQEHADVERHTESLAELLTDVMGRSGLPKESATAVFPRLASFYSAVESTGGKVDPDLAAQRLRATIEAEHKALYFKDDGKGGKTVNVEAIRALFGEEGLRAIQKEAVASWKAKQVVGQPQPPAQAPSARENRQEGTSTKGGNYWRRLESQFK